MLIRRSPYKSSLSFQCRVECRASIYIWVVFDGKICDAWQKHCPPYIIDHFLWVFGCQFERFFFSFEMPYLSVVVLPKPWQIICRPCIIILVKLLLYQKRRTQRWKKTCFQKKLRVMKTVCVRVCYAYIQSMRYANNFGRNFKMKLLS